jgi:hypothetical protein
MDVMEMTKERRGLPVAPGKVRRTWSLPEELIAELEAWRATQRPIPTESQAATELMLDALRRWRERQAKEEKPPST